MPSIFLGTEADEGMGHVVPWSGFIALALEHGYEVHMGAPDVGLLNTHLGECHPKVGIWSSPCLGKNAQSIEHSFSVTSWSELLVSLGYADAKALIGAVKAWRSILTRVEPSVVLADYAPALILAAKSLNVPVFEVGNGFCVPPLTPEQECFPGIKNRDEHALTSANAQLVRAYNECLGFFGSRRISAFAETKDWPVARVVMSPHELDPYGLRVGVVYAGLLQSTANNDSRQSIKNWPPIVGYLLSLIHI